MLLVSFVLFVGVALVAYLFVNSAEEYFGFDVSTGLHLGIALVAGFIVAFSGVGIYKSRCKRCNEQHIASLKP